MNIKAFQVANNYLKENHKLFTEDEEFQQFTEFYHRLFSFMKLNVCIKQCENLAYETVFNDNKVVFYNDVDDALLKLKQTYKLAILSDTWPSIKRILRNKNILSCFDAIIASCYYGHTKESTVIFEIAINTLQEKPDNILFIDDSTVNLYNARKTGMHPILMDRSKKSGNTSYPVIASLDEVLLKIQYYNKPPM